jgi:hypothetical protein
MSQLLTKTEISARVWEASGQAQNRAFVASAFCRSEAFLKHLANVNADGVDKKILTRWQARDLLCGASDLELFSAATSMGWKLYLNQDLHAKAFLFDQKAIVGSANLTHRGFLGAPPNGNHELAATLTDSNELGAWFESIISQSRLVDEELFTAIEQDIKEIQSQSKNDALNIKSFSPHTMKLISFGNGFNLYTHDLFWTDSPARLTEPHDVSTKNSFIEHDRDLLGGVAPINRDFLLEAFRRSKGFLWLRSIVREEIYFGELSQRLHDALLDDPAPYRQEVKGLVSNLLGWTAELASDIFTIDTPKHSQRVRAINSSEPDARERKKTPDRRGVGIGHEGLPCPSQREIDQEPSGSENP